VELEWDEAKRQWTLENRNLDFADVTDFDFGTADTVEDNRTDNGEVRFVSTGVLHDRLCVLCWTRRGNTVRVISLRKANDRKKQIYRPASP
jgi:uncharacterized DUF497 family protein